jgi:hypothetical protein
VDRAEAVGTEGLRDGRGLGEEGNWLTEKEKKMKKVGQLKPVLLTPFQVRFWHQSFKLHSGVFLAMCLK